VCPRTAGGAAIGDSVVGGRVGQHAGAAGGKDLLVVLVAHGQHGVGQSAAQRGHVGLGVELRGVEDDQVRHGGLSVRRR